eukprot:CAMPEP_0119064048 /NCGR_PEP_ID=MMETSP1178-20130426/7238_1 /TAXON_ID=33656 /ORGANISM="unid sp, Strain CCMP2000" /LENGTH=246 /DNA_ID=CAMNT_0007045455 /DNA_START=73 /DNA_END=810 /DNA_ORIENTATION=+
MCQDNVNLPKEANKAKCFVISCFVFSIFSMIGFGASWAGAIGAVCGILACIGSSILMCCAPKTPQEGGGKFCAAAVLLLIGGIIQLIMSIVVLVLMIALLNEVNEKSYCDDHFVDCTTDSDGTNCADWYGADAKCSKNENCVGTNDDDYYNDCSFDGTTSCTSNSVYEFCVSIHGGAKDVVSGIIVVVFGITIAFLLVAGILNTIGGAYCIVAKSAIEAMKANGPPVAGAATAVPVAAQAVAAQAE